MKFAAEPIAQQYEAEIAAIIETGRRLYARGLVAATDGNISCRVDGGFLITAANVSKGFLGAEHILLLNAAGEPLSPSPHQPSSETALHLAIYAARQDIDAVLHAHPPYATAFALAGRGLDNSGLTELKLQVGAVPLTEYAPPGSAELAEITARAFLHADAALLARHGAVTAAAMPETALFRMEALEQAAKIIWLAGKL